MIDKIGDNLYEFYDKFSTSEKLNHFHDSNVSWIKNNNGLWPNYIYRTNHISPSSTSNYIDKIKDHEAPPFWILNKNNSDEKLISELKKGGMREILQWSGIATKLINPPAVSPIKDFEIVRITSKKELDSWIKIVNEEVMSSNQLKSELFDNFLNDKEIILYLGLLNNHPVSTLLSFTKNNVCGLYMLSTSKNQRGKGLGKEMLSKCLLDSFDKNITEIIGQAQPGGNYLLKKMGFKKYCEFSIYWMLGKEFK